MPGIMPSDLRGLTHLLLTLCPKEIAIIPVLQMKKLRQRAIKECSQCHSAVRDVFNFRIFHLFLCGNHKEVYIVGGFKLSLEVWVKYL